MAEKTFEGTILKAVKKHGLAIGHSIICTIQGEPYFDLQDDHIPDEVMLDAAVEFAKSERPAEVMHNGVPIGTIRFMFPLTAEIAKALGIQSEMTGLLIAMEPDEETFGRIESGELTGFSIRGTARAQAV